MCQMIITDFDNDILEADRKDSQGVKIRFTQALLNKAGFDPGPVDGKPGKQTKIALRQYQSKYGLPVTRELDDATWVSLAQFISR
jgi:g-D-glutamyl-meso-diaminopimelate peptidase